MTVGTESFKQLAVKEGVIFVNISSDFETYNNPEVIAICSDDSSRVIPVWNLCYLKTHGHRSNQSLRVDEGSFVEILRKPVLSLIDFLKECNKFDTARAHFLAIRRFHLWLTLEQNYDYSDLSETKLKSLYRDYTANLLYRVRLPQTLEERKEKLTNNSASFIQKSAVKWISILTSISEERIRYWSTRILIKDSQKDLNLVDESRFPKAMTSGCKLLSAYYMHFIAGVDEDTIGAQVDTERFGESFYANQVTTLGLYLFIAATGANLALARSLNYVDSDFSPTIKGMRYSGYKERAKGRLVALEFGAKFLVFWKKYLELRAKFFGNKTELLFPYFKSDASICLLPTNRLESSRGLLKSISNLHSFDAPTTREWRKYREREIGRISGDISVAAEMQGHKLSTAVKNYQGIDFNTASLELSNALSLMYSRAISVTRESNSIAVKIVDTRTVAKDIPAGECNSVGALLPARAKGFTTLSPEPNCRVKETCIFCEHYAAHSDGEDLRKLLSLRYMANLLRDEMPIDSWVNKWGPVLHRVDEIIDSILENSPSLKNEYLGIKKSVDNGYLDDFWLMHLETLYYVGIVS